MRAFALLFLSCLMIGCLSTTRTREIHCYGTLMVDVWESQRHKESLEDEWRGRQRAQAGQLSVPAGHGKPLPIELITDRPSGLTPTRNYRREDELYGRVVQARARYAETAAWYRRVARRVETRFEEDDMLYPLLGMAITAPASLLFYPLVRWNVRSALWDDIDPDADDDPIRQFCDARLKQGGDGARAAPVSTTPMAETLRPVSDRAPGS